MKKSNYYQDRNKSYLLANKSYITANQTNKK